ncbi:MAG: GNAT family N-acetyltransferase [Cloacibacterium normanense]
MDFSIQPILETNKVRLVPLQESDFERLYQVASDPLVWEQHPNKNRFQKDIFRNFFDGAMISEGAFIIIDKISNEVAGSTRFYSYDEDENSIFIGYTFYGRKFWGGQLNPIVKNDVRLYFPICRFGEVSCRRRKLAFKKSHGKIRSRIQRRSNGSVSRRTYQTKRRILD